MPLRTDPLEILDQAIARAGGAKVMLRLEEARLIRAALKLKLDAAQGAAANDLLLKVQKKVEE